MDKQEFIRDFLGIKDETLLQTLKQASTIRELKKGELFIRAGQRQSEIVILLSGIFRGYYFDSSGDEVTDCFGNVPGTCMISCDGLNSISSIWIEVLTDSKVLCIPVSVVLESIQKHHEMSLIYNQYLIEALQRHWTTKMMLSQCNAMDRYKWFMKEYPELVDCISKKNIASFLNIKPQTLSRLRKNLRETNAENLE